MRNGISRIAAAALVTALGITSAHGAVQTYSAATMVGGEGIDHPGFGFFQFDPGLWDDGLDANPRFNNPAGTGGGEFAFSGSDGGFHMQVNTVLGQGFSGKATDHAAFFKMDHDNNPPNSFGTFWFGGVGNDIGPYPSIGGVPVPLADVLVFADVIAPAGKPMEFRTESNYGPSGNGRKFAFTGTGTWQTVGGALSGATAFGTFNLADTQIASLISFGQNGNEITAVDDGTDPANVPTVTVDNLTMTIAQASWTGAAGGNWGDNTKWNIIAPDGPNATAVFGGSSAQTVNMELDHFIGTMQLNNAAGYTFSGVGTLALRGIGVGAAIDALAGSHTISSPVDLYSPTTVNVAGAGATMTVSNLQPSNVGVAKTGPGTLAVNNVRAASLAVNGGTVSVIANGTDSGVSRVSTVSVSGGARLDLRDNDLIVTGGTYAGVTNAIASARAGGNWNGSGITSSTAAAATPKNKTLGTLTGAQLISTGVNSFGGFTVAPSDIIVKFTYYGDTDFNGVVNFDDYSRTDNGFNSGGNEWFEGDFDYNNLVNFDDYSLIDLSFNTQTGTLRDAISFLDGSDRNDSKMTSPGLQKVLEHFNQFGEGYATSFLNAVPEPSSALVLGGLAALGASKRRRRSI